jgi:hypothetical protein
MVLTVIVFHPVLIVLVCPSRASVPSLKMFTSLLEARTTQITHMIWGTFLFYLR